MARLRVRLTYANVMATIAVFIALGGASYAALKLPKNSVGTKQIKKNAVTTAKIKKGAVTGGKINLSTLGTVPSATNAANAGHADAANNATNAGHAETATIATALSAPEPVHFIGDPGEPQFESGYVNAYEGETPAGFWKDHDCMVHMFGIVEGEAQKSVFTLPASYRPFQETETDAALILPFNTTPAEVAWGAIFSGGELNVYGFAGKVPIDLGGFNFRAASC
jgi:hypothetical protein